MAATTEAAADKTKATLAWELWGCVAGMFLLQLCHAHLQERIFTTVPGFNYGWFMTAFELALVSVFSLSFEPTSLREVAALDKGSLGSLAVMSLVLVLSQGTGTAALSYVNYHTKVMFKSAKLIPAMLMGRVVTGRSYRARQYFGASVVVVALVLFSLTDAQLDVPNQTLGYVLLTIAVICDALLPNMQERCLVQLAIQKADMMLVSNMIAAVLTAVYIGYTGEALAALRLCMERPRLVGFLLLQAGSCYGSVIFYLRVVRARGAASAVLAANCRKALSIVFSFLLFPDKPASANYAVALALMVVGVSLSLGDTEGAVKKAS